jgi:hypothetical protein
VVRALSNPVTKLIGRELYPLVSEILESQADREIVMSIVARTLASRGMSLAKEKVSELLDEMLQALYQDFAAGEGQ